LRSNDPNAQLYALQMLGGRLNKSERRDVIKDLLHAKDPFILKTAINYIQDHKITGLNKALEAHLEHGDVEVTKAAIHAYCDLKKTECIEYFLKIIDTVDAERQDTIIAGAIKYGGLAGAIEFGRRLLDMLSDDNPSNRMRAAFIIGEIGNENYYLPLMDLLKDSDLNVRQSAVIAAGKVKNNALVPALLKAGKKRRLFLEAKKSLGKFGAGVTDSIASIIHKKGPARDIIYIKLLSLNNDSSVSQFYERMLESKNFEVRRATINALFQRSYKCENGSQSLTNNIINALINSCNQLLKDYELNSNRQCLELIYNELFHIQILLLYQCLSFKYQKRAIQDIIDNTYRKETEYKTIALELLENTLNPRDGRKIIPIIEKTYDLNLNIQSDIPTDVSADFFHRIILDANHNFSSWITANAIRYHRINNLKSQIPVDLTASDIHLINQEANALAIT
ncbi:MAG: HEAT repeat domain-containing protein, partial [Saprospiraceae bacterium]|nr:HEAT repeat domain-containing protein [Saprospiraceae bacterium]